MQSLKGQNDPVTSAMRRLVKLAAAVAAMAFVAIGCTSSTTVSEGQLDDAAQRDANAALTEPEDAVDSGGGDADTDLDNNGDSETVTDADADAAAAARESTQFAILAEDCQNGSDLACDILFPISDFGSGEEALARDCGGRGESPDGFCTEGFVRSDEGPWFDPDSDGAGRVVDECVQGDPTACDFLYFNSPLNSEFESIGISCGGRVAVAVPNCRTVLADE